MRERGIHGFQNAPRFEITALIETDWIEFMVPNWPAVLVNRRKWAGKTVNNWDSGTGSFVIDSDHGMLASKENFQFVGRVRSFPKPCKSAVSKFNNSVYRQSLRAMFEL